MMRRLIRALVIQPAMIAALRVKLFLLRGRTYRRMKRAVRSLTLNSLGGLYGVRRVKGERDTSYERRILKAASAAPPNMEKEQDT